MMIASATGSPTVVSAESMTGLSWWVRPARVELALART